MEKNVSMQSGPNAREGMKGPIVSDQKIHVASTPTYSGANNGAFALKRRVVILYSAAAPIPDSIYNHQSKSPILFALPLHFFFFFALFIAPLFIITLLKEITACAWKPTHRHLLHPPPHPPMVDSLMFNSHVQHDDDERLSRSDERSSDVLIVDFLRAAQSPPRRT